MPFAQRYEHSYGISLLDDLHNLFPEILYDPLRFQQNTLVQFVRERTEELFDVEFARNRAYYRLYIQPRSASISASIPVPTTPPPRARQSSPPPLPVRSRSFRVPLTVPIMTTTDINDTIDTTMNTTMNLLTTAFLGGLGSGSADLQDLLAPVAVFPTADQIAQASILSSIEPPADVACAICQDHAPPSGTHEWRILRSCTHRFHKQCIDVWFRQNVHCPVCRHDIREPATT